jgi:hypothetical protein
MAEPHPIPVDPRFQDITGRVFGKLTVLFYAGRKSGKYSLWHCRCECGKERTCVSSQLTLGQTNTCLSCFRHRPKAKRRTDFVDFAGKTFGRLTVIEIDRHVKTSLGSRTFWKCRCSCGETAVVRGDNLKSGKTESCGCLNVSKRWVDQPIPAEGTCRKCNKAFPLTTDHFYRHPKAKFGFRLVCQPCVRDAANAAHRRQVGKIRKQALVHYSGDPPKCQCPHCPETLSEFLTIDHVGGGGNRHRIQINGRNIYRWLRINKYPPGFRVLCMNCNFSLGKYGYCPHDSHTQSTKK